MFVGHPIPGNADIRSRPFQQESFYDVPGLMADPRYQKSMRLIERYSLLPFMTPRQFYYPRVVRQFYHSMTSRDADGPQEIHFRIDDRRGVLSPAVISAALRLRIPPRNAEGYRDWAHPPPRAMVRALARDVTASWSSPLSEAASASYAAHRPSAAHLFIPYAALCAEEWAYLGGIVPDLGQFLVQPIRAGDDFALTV